MGEWYSQSVNDFRGRILSEPAVPAGYAALIERYDLGVPLPPRLVAISRQHHPKSTDVWLMLTPRHQPSQTFGDQLTFALRYEGVDLQILLRLFRSVLPDEIADTIRKHPTGKFARRIWFLFEWLTGDRLDLPDAGKVAAVPVLDPKQQFALADGDPAPRYKVINNLPGTPAFCPLVSRTPELDALSQKGLAEQAMAVMGRVRKDLINRAAAFILLKDSRSSFAIENETPDNTRATRWGEAIAQAGSRDLNLDELDRLQRIVIADARFVRRGLRMEGGFVGTHDRESGAPVPDHISARPDDLRGLIDGLAAFSARAAAGKLDPVIAAACLAFGFVYIHPYEDGNGRLHRWLIHHALAAARYNPPGLVFPVSAVIYDRIEDYRAVLESYSRPLLPLIQWRATPRNNVEVLNDTGDFYRFFNATAHARFLYECVERTVEVDLPNEVRFLQDYEVFRERLQDIVDMPDVKVSLIYKFLFQNGGKLSRRARENEFALLTDDEADRIVGLYAETLGCHSKSSPLPM